jgi:hypothetical protein
MHTILRLPRRSHNSQIIWAVFAARWRQKTVALGRVSALAFVFLALGLLLTFPPFGDLLLGR